MDVVARTDADARTGVDVTTDVDVTMDAAYLTVVSAATDAAQSCGLSFYFAAAATAIAGAMDVATDAVTTVVSSLFCCCFAAVEMDFAANPV